MICSLSKYSTYLHYDFGKVDVTQNKKKKCLYLKDENTDLQVLGFFLKQGIYDRSTCKIFSLCYIGDIEHV